MRCEMVLNPLYTERRHKYLLKTAVEAVGLPVHFDEELLFWANHFDGKQWSTYDNGVRKGGTLRFKDGFVRLPIEQRLLVYETEERKKDRPFPRAAVDIVKVTVCPASELSYEELSKDGFVDHEQMLEDMTQYYSAMTAQSIVSFYEFGNADWRDKNDFVWIAFGDAGFWSKKRNRRF